MLIAKVIDNQVIELADYRSLFPNVSFPTTGPDESFLLENSCMKVDSFKPHTNTQKLEACTPYVENGVVYSVKVVDKTEADLAAEKASKSAQKRAERDRLLSSCDWTQLPDVNIPNKAEWAAYRQELRDITNNPAFPDVDFPKDPDYVAPQEV